MCKKSRDNPELIWWLYEIRDLYSFQLSITIPVCGLHVCGQDGYWSFSHSILILRRKRWKEGTTGAHTVCFLKAVIPLLYHCSERSYLFTAVCKEAGEKISFYSRWSFSWITIMGFITKEERENEYYSRKAAVLPKMIHPWVLGWTESLPCHFKIPVAILPTTWTWVADQGMLWRRWHRGVQVGK